MGKKMSALGETINKTIGKFRGRRQHFQKEELKEHTKRK